MTVTFEGMDDEEEDSVDDSSPHESFEDVSQQVRGANLVFAHMMQSLESYD